jgi:hypothetical protein
MGEGGCWRPSHEHAGFGSHARSRQVLAERDVGFGVAPMSLFDMTPDPPYLDGLPSWPTRTHHPRLRSRYMSSIALLAPHIQYWHPTEATIFRADTERLSFIQPRQALPTAACVAPTRLLPAQLALLGSAASAGKPARRRPSRSGPHPLISSPLPSAPGGEAVGHPAGPGLLSQGRRLHMPAHHQTRYPPRKKYCQHGWNMTRVG